MSIFGDPSRYQNFHGMISSLYASGKYSDLTIKCQGKEWKVHRNVVCSQSKPLAAAVDGNFKHGETTGEIALDEDDPEIVNLMLYYLYHGHYQDGSGFVRDPDTLLFGASSNTKSPPCFSFGSTAPSAAPPTSANATSSIFPQAPRPSHPFAPSTTSTNPTALFGSSTARPTSSTSFVFNPQQATSSTSNMFGSLRPSTNLLPNAQPATSSTGGLFGAPPSNTSTTTATSSGSSLFSGLTATAPAKAQSSSNAAIRSEALVTNAKVYIMAEQYDIQPPKIYSKGKYQEILPATWNSPSFVESLRLIYDGTPERSSMDVSKGILWSLDLGDQIKHLSPLIRDKRTGSGLSRKISRHLDYLHVSQPCLKL